jgi:hypothetical protein
MTALASAASLPVVFTVAGFLGWLATDYPHFVVRDAREQIGLPNGPFR